MAPSRSGAFARWLAAFGRTHSSRGDVFAEGRTEGGQMGGERPHIIDAKVGMQDTLKSGLHPPTSVLHIIGFWVMALVIFLLVAVLVVQVYKRVLVKRVSQAKAAPVPRLSSYAVQNDIVEDYSLKVDWFFIGFKDEQAEVKWYENGEDAKQIASRARVLCFVAASMMGYEVFRMVQSYFSPLRTCFMHVPLFFVLCVVLRATMHCWRHPSELIYWLVVFFFYFYIPATSLPPLTPACSDLANLAQIERASCEGQGPTFDCLLEAVRHTDCSPQGHTAMQMLMTWLLLQPWVLPQLEHIYMVWFWVLLAYPGWICADWLMTGAVVFGFNDLCFRVFLLSSTLVVAIAKKYTLERSRHIKFLQELQQKASSAKIFHILEFMMPVHVIGPMLMYPGTPIAAQVDRVSILFVLINEFDQFTRRMTPSELLRFLNDQFTTFDDICAAHKVTKIETVGEEYVACVGVLPHDIQENQSSGHGVLLERLFAAGSQMLQVQTDEVKFKMGIHSGPIVAGVIGTKLPRYRLFGDTINSAARMMQKGLPGQLQFGVETHGDLPQHLLEQVKYRGEVEMKGKGKVKAYTFEATHEPEGPIARRRTRAGSVASRTREKRSSITAVALADPDADEELAGTSTSQFEDALLQMQSHNEQAKSRRWILSEREGFTEELERKWFTSFHESIICHKIVRRFGNEVILVLLLSGLELRYMLEMNGSFADHPFYKEKGSRLAVFVYCRGLVLLIGVLWWYFAEMANESVRNNPGRTQTLILASCCTAIALIYISYDALVFSNTEEYRRDKNFVNEYHVPPDQVFTLNFVLFVFLFMRNHMLLFFPSLVFLPLAVLIISAPNIYGLVRSLFPRAGLPIWESMYPSQGELLFVALAVVIVIVAHEDEQAHRARFKARHVVQETQKRTEGILDTLMPPLVVSSLHQLEAHEPMLTNQYRHATIAQSDLCGFTALSAKRTPAEVVKFMGDLFGAFDRLTDIHGVYKVETVGDAYIAGMAERPLTKEYSPYHVLCFGLDMVRAVDDWAAAMRVKVACRVGIAYGECIGGIVGTDMQRYHLFGDLLSCMEILESTAPEGRVQISGPCKQEVERQLREEKDTEWPEVLKFSEREDKELKTSKGEVHEYSEVGGPTFLVHSSRPLRNTNSQESKPRDAAQSGDLEQGLSNWGEAYWEAYRGTARQVELTGRHVPPSA